MQQPRSCPVDLAPSGRGSQLQRNLDPGGRPVPRKGSTGTLVHSLQGFHLGPQIATCHCLYIDSPPPTGEAGKTPSCSFIQLKAPGDQRMPRPPAGQQCILLAPPPGKHKERDVSSFPFNIHTQHRRNGVRRPTLSRSWPTAGTRGPGGHVRSLCTGDGDMIAPQVSSRGWGGGGLLCLLFPWLLFSSSRWLFMDHCPWPCPSLSPWGAQLFQPNSPGPRSG